MGKEESQMLNVMAYPSQSLNSNWPSECARGESYVGPEEKSLGQEVTACRIGGAHGGQIFLGKQGEESLADVVVLPEAVERCGYCCHF